jgi:hypothetical protein
MTVELKKKKKKSYLIQLQQLSDNDNYSDLL